MSEDTVFYLFRTSMSITIVEPEGYKREGMRCREIGIRRQGPAARHLPVRHR